LDEVRQWLNRLALLGMHRPIGIRPEQEKSEEEAENTYRRPSRLCLNCGYHLVLCSYCFLDLTHRTAPREWPPIEIGNARAKTARRFTYGSPYDLSQME
jgi:hypothetical protein